METKGRDNSYHLIKVLSPVSMREHFTICKTAPPKCDVVTGTALCSL